MFDQINACVEFNVRMTAFWKRKKNYVAELLNILNSHYLGIESGTNLIRNLALKQCWNPITLCCLTSLFISFLSCHRCISTKVWVRIRHIWHYLTHILVYQFISIRRESWVSSVSILIPSVIPLLVSLKRFPTDIFQRSIEDKPFSTWTWHFDFRSMTPPTTLIFQISISSLSRHVSLKGLLVRSDLQVFQSSALGSYCYHPCAGFSLFPFPASLITCYPW